MEQKEETKHFSNKYNTGDSDVEFGKFLSIIIIGIIIAILYFTHIAEIIWIIIAFPFEAMAGICITGRTPIISTQLSDPSFLDFLLGMLGSLCVLVIILTIIIRIFKR